MVHNDQIKIEYFPEIQITKISDLRGKSESEFNVITFETRVNSYPYLVSLDEIQSLITPNDNLPSFLTCLLYSFSSIAS